MTGVISRAAKLSKLRFFVGYLAIVGTVPYLGLKALWLSGSTVGITDAEFANDPTMYGLNVLTAGMDVVAIALALTFTHSWGQRAPAWLVLFPIWVGTGFLAPIVVVAPLVVVGSLFTTAPAQDGAGALPLADWVQPLVYGSFVVQGLALLTAFVLYACVRWERLLSSRTSPLVAPSTIRLAAVGAVGAAFAGVVHLTRAFGAAPTLSAATVEVSRGLIALGSILAVVLLVRGRAKALWPPLALVWATAAGMFAWGGWGALNVVIGSALVGGDVDVPQFAASLAQMTAGVLFAVVLYRTVRAAADVSGGAPVPAGSA